MKIKEMSVGQKFHATSHTASYMVTDAAKMAGVTTEVWCVTVESPLFEIGSICRFELDCDEELRIYA